MPCILGHFEKCISYQTNYKCLCRHGFRGVNCEIENNECESSPCENGGNTKPNFFSVIFFIKFCLFKIVKEYASITLIHTNAFVQMDLAGRHAP